MAELLSGGWQDGAALVLIGLGVALGVRAAGICRAAWRRPLTGSMQPLDWMRGFRLAVIGMAVAGVGAAWLWHAPWLLALALAVAFEETLECSICIAALRRAPRHRSATPPGMT